MQKVKLMDIVIDPNLQVRNVEDWTVSKYAQSMKAGAKFPPLVLESKTNRLVCGNHRYFAYKSAYKDPEHKIDALHKTFKSEADIIRLAAKDNAIHGKPLSPYDCKSIILRLKQYGDSESDISGLLNIPIKKVVKLAGMNVVVVGNGKKPEYKPIKHGLEHMAGKQISAKDYEAHEKMDLGKPIRQLASQLTRHIKSGWVDELDEKTIGELEALYKALEKFLEGVKAN